jgi:hypothetical protein
VRCNRVAYGFYVGACWYPLLTGTPAWALAGKLIRIAARHPRLLVTTAGWLRRAGRRAGGARACFATGRGRSRS